MKTLRIILVVLLVLYGIGPLIGAILSLFNQTKLAEWQHLGEMTTGMQKLMLLSAGTLAAQVWLYFSAIALLITNMKQGYMYAVTCGFVKLIEAIVIVAGLGTHSFGSATDYIAILEGVLLLIVALIAFKKSSNSETQTA